MQKPHPPLWVACSRRETIHLAARSGIGALTFSFIDPGEAGKWVREYYDILKRECIPLGHAVNANVAMVTGFSCHPEQAEAEARGLDGFRFFGYALGHHYIYGEHKPGFTDIWKRFEAARGSLPTAPWSCIGTPDLVRDNLRAYARAGVDQVIFIQQGGRNRHEHICESLELFARDVMPEFHDGEVERQVAKQAQLAPFVESAMTKKPRNEPLTEATAPIVAALGRSIVASALTPQEIQAAVTYSQATGVPLVDPAEK